MPTTRRPDAGDESGFSLVELMVVMMIMMIVTFILFGFLDSTTRLTARQANRTEAENAANLALRRVSEDLRSATFITACPSPATYASCIKFSVPAQGPNASCPERTVTYQLSGSVLEETQISYSSSCAVTTTYNGATVLSSMVNDSSHPLFTYYNSSQSQIDVVNDPSAVPAAVAALVTVQVSYTGASSVLTLSNFVALRNNR
ncbi:MAG TPA: prepilin-type N-terminal cleavage/methylation domain-containing protein [Acidimicrobiales bacterium]|nr:prepilin-type N-terminal cleavage/methylation domain-containing protein [Acidimicrobiales bacterium]